MRILTLALLLAGVSSTAALAQMPKPPDTLVHLLGRTVDEHVARTDQRAQHIATLRRALTECGDCPDRGRISGALAAWTDRHERISVAERAALQTMGQHTRYASLEELFGESAPESYAAAIGDTAARRRKHDLEMIDAAVTAQCGFETGRVAFVDGQPETVPGVEILRPYENCLSKRRPLEEELYAFLRTAIHFCSPDPIDIGTKRGVAFRERTRYETGVDHYVELDPAFFTCMYLNSAATRWCVEDRKRRYDAGNSVKLARHRERWGPNARLDLAEFDIRSGTADCYRVRR